MKMSLFFIKKRCGEENFFIAAAPSQQLNSSNKCNFSINILN